MITYFLAWFPMIVLAVLNGLFRESVIRKWASETTAHQLSTATLILLLGLYIYFILRRFPPVSVGQAFAIGLWWMVLTLIFEFGMGLFRGMSWPAMLADYNLLKGRLWVFVPVWILVSPAFISWLSDKH